MIMFKYIIFSKLRAPFSLFLSSACRLYVIDWYLVRYNFIRACK